MYIVRISDLVLSWTRICALHIFSAPLQAKRRNALRRAADTPLALAWANLEQFGSTN